MGLFDDEELTKIEEKPSKLKETATTIGGCFLYLAFFLGGITLILLIIRGVPWIAENIYPWVSIICAGFVILALPISILLAIFKKTREVSAIGFLLSSYALGINLWLSSLILAYIYAGTFWMIVGLLFGGIGVVPIAFIASLIRAEWSSAIQIFITVSIVYGTRALSVYLTESKDKTNDESDENFEKDFNDIWEEQQRTNKIVEDFGIFLEVEKPLINDIDCLPYSKSEIHSALMKKEQELCDIANNCVKTGETEKLPELEKLINALGSCRVFLQSYSKIDSEDREDVDYFNAFQDADEIPEDEQNEFAILRAKYMTKWLKEDDKVVLEAKNVITEEEDSLFDLDEIDEIVDYFLDFIDEQPLIHDVTELYYSQDEIDKALIWKEHELQASKFRSEQMRDDEKATELEIFINAIRSARELLFSYVKINPEDCVDVEYFNDFESEKDIPREEKAKFETLRARYLMKWTNEINSEINESDE